MRFQLFTYIFLFVVTCSSLAQKKDTSKHIEIRFESSFEKNQASQLLKKKFDKLNSVNNQKLKLIRSFNPNPHLNNISKLKFNLPDITKRDTILDYYTKQIKIRQDSIRSRLLQDIAKLSMSFKDFKIDSFRYSYPALDKTTYSHSDVIDLTRAQKNDSDNNFSTRFYIIFVLSLVVFFILYFYFLNAAPYFRKKFFRYRENSKEKSRLESQKERVKDLID